MIRLTRHHMLVALAAGVLATLALAAPRTARAGIGADAILDSLEASAFRYFWYQANPANGLIRDRSTVGSPCSIAATGFGLSALCIGVDRGYVTRAAAASRVRTTLETFWNGPQGPFNSNETGYKGFFYHFLDMNTAYRMPGWNPELSSIDTALLLAGILDARQYFTGTAPDEVQIRTLADQIYQRVDWDWMRNTSNNAIRHGWNPDNVGGPGTFLPYDWIGYNEASILYILALGSPTHPVPAASWTAWTSGYPAYWGTQYGYTYLTFAPLFGHQYSQCWLDLRAIRDAYMLSKGITYFENSRRATYAQRAYSIANPGGFVGYGANLWGLTASDDPCVGYTAHGAPPSQNDNGTITPTAPISSIPFAPEICIPVAQNMYDTYAAQLWGAYGFKDAFSLTHASGSLCNPGTWYDADVLGIDQGPIILMIENYRSASVWRRFTGASEIRNGLTAAGFTGVTGVSDQEAAVGTFDLLPASPNPFRGETTLRYLLPRAGHVRVTVYDLAGRAVARLVDGLEGAGFHDARLGGQGLASGVYRARLESEGRAIERTIVHLR